MNSNPSPDSEIDLKPPIGLKRSRNAKLSPALTTTNKMTELLDYEKIRASLGSPELYF